MPTTCCLFLLHPKKAASSVFSFNWKAKSLGGQSNLIPMLSFNLAYGGLVYQWHFGPMWVDLHMDNDGWVWGESVKSMEFRRPRISLTLQVAGCCISSGVENTYIWKLRGAIFTHNAKQLAESLQHTAAHLKVSCVCVQGCMLKDKQRAIFLPQKYHAGELDWANLSHCSRSANELL